MLQHFTLMIFPALMTFAAASDFLTMKIPNLISIALVFGYFVFAAWFGFSWESVAFHGLAAFLVLALALLAYLPGWMGGGDVKLAAAIALWVGWEHLLGYGILTSFAGGFLTLAVMGVAYLDFTPWISSMPFVRLLARNVNCVPYGIALAAGGLLIYPHTEIWRSISGL
jgi:prepilin peptidase CpaA